MGVGEEGRGDGWCGVRGRVHNVAVGGSANGNDNGNGNGNDNGNVDFDARVVSTSCRWFNRHNHTQF